MNNSYNKESKIIIIPNGTQKIDDETFMGFDKLEEIVIPNSVEYIGKKAFKSCKSLQKVKLPNNLQILDDLAFSECESLEEITIPSSLHYFSYGVFSYCHNLKRLNTHDKIDFINDFALYNCRSLENFDIPAQVISIHKKALMGCESLKSINIPKKVDCIEYGAFAFMTSLEKITVDEENEKYLSVDDNTALVSKDNMIIQYAINCDRDEFIVGYYKTDISGINMETLIYNIADYAFAGAKKLKKLHINSELEGIGGKTFAKCDNLKDLEIFHTSYGETFILNIFSEPKKEIEIPFENIIIEEGVKTLCGESPDLFKSAKNISLPNSLENINENIFTKSKNLKSLKLPNNIKSIFPNTFYPEICLTFPDFGTIKAKEFNMLQTKTNEKFFEQNLIRDNTRIFSLNDGTYYVTIEDFDTVKVTKDEIANFSRNSNIMLDRPEDFVIYLINLLRINIESDRLLISIWTNPKLEEKFREFATDCDYIEEIVNKKISRAIREMLEIAGIYDELLINGLLMNNLKRNDILKIISNYNNSLNRFIKLGSFNIDNKINIDKLIRYCNLLDKYQKYDRFLYNSILFENITYDNQELLIKYFNKNIKHLLTNSKTLDDFYGQNLNDLLKLCNSLGIFSDNEKISQKMSTFLNEKIVNENSSTPIVGDTIHTIFSDLKPREEIDYEYINFFVKNYKELFELEKEKSGIIARIYNSFRDISKTSTSHRGSQRHLMVTIEKCLDYFLTERFDGVNENNKELANLLQKYYSESQALKVGEMILEQSKNAPRNIFSKIEYEDDEPIYSYNSNEDLLENNKDSFSYHWLPKQDYDNLILGKYCNCCAHILGAGGGIMRASMINSDCQNLVIRNKSQEIIAKMTIYVNRTQGYAVYNTTEINTSYQDDENLEEIYRAFIRGTNAFIDKYNENNEIPISIVSIGEYRNLLVENLGNIETKLYKTPQYSSYCYYVGEDIMGTYNGDSNKKQILVLKR